MDLDTGKYSDLSEKERFLKEVIDSARLLQSGRLWKSESEESKKIVKK